MDDPVDLAHDLIAIDSINPALVPFGAGEREIASFCADWLAGRGFDVERLESVQGRPSVVGIRRGSGGGRSLLLNGHLDTVGVASPAQLQPRVRDGRLYGRGAFDMKGGIAAMLVAAASSDPPRGDVIVALVADEEFGSHGTEEVLARYHADAAIVAEPSQLELTVSHRGFAWFEVVVTGLASHGSMPEQGIDAIAHAGGIMAALDVLRSALESRPPHPQLGYGTVRVATIDGGVDAATVAPSCTLTIERRFLPGESPDAVEAELRAVVEAVPGEAAVSVTRLVARGAFEAQEGWPIVAAVRRGMTEVLGAVATRGEPFWTDAGLILEAGIPCVVLGVVGSGAHADEEWASTASIGHLADILRRTIAEFCA